MSYIYQIKHSNKTHSPLLFELKQYVNYIFEYSGIGLVLIKKKKKKTRFVKSDWKDQYLNFENHVLNIKKSIIKVQIWNEYNSRVIKSEKKKRKKKTLS